MLPVNHTYPYDVMKIPVLPNALSLEHRLSFVQSSENALFEWGDITRSYFQGQGLHLILEDYHQIDEELQDWMKRVLRFFSQIIFNCTAT